jgi:hypothetical protein
MCTVLIAIKAGGGFIVAANRDELETRPRAHLPDFFEHEGMTVVYPVDPVGGGTWISANASGLVLTLLNHYQAGHAPIEPLSRGLIIKHLATCRHLDEVIASFETTFGDAMDRLAGFTLLATFSDATGEVDGRRIRWDGVHLTIEVLPLPWVEVSSSVAPQAALALRRHQLATLLDAPLSSWQQALSVFKDHGAAPGPLSVCMHRHDAHTVSHTGVEVSPEGVTLHYIDGSPCSGRLTGPWQLVRSR